MKEPVDKKQALLRAALEEFGQRGYESASTNRMTQAAGVSKGMLFHLFEDKRTLFLRLVDDTLERYIAAMEAALPNRPIDLFEAIGLLSGAKAELVGRDPAAFGLLAKAFVHVPDELREELAERQRKLQERSIAMLAAKADRTRFRAGVDVERATELVMLALEAVLNRMLTSLSAEERERGRLREPLLEPYIDLLKKGLYEVEARR
ncbi:TetR/AcrR family transcriptional regulator [Paenibacillus sp. TRM 82003]|nr:TetR/AcrR family transcriptional regulator [Paenibacillus sp. TRM 82003]